MEPTDEKPTEMEAKIMLSLLLRGGEMDWSEYYDMYREQNPVEETTNLGPKGFVGENRAEEAYLTDKGKKALEDMT